jgi:hypothetical protein
MMLLAKNLKPGTKFCFRADLRRGIYIPYIRCDDPAVFYIECASGRLIRHDSGLENMEVELTKDQET